MNVSLYQAASAMNAHARWQEVVSENLASASIPGYKKQDLSFAAVQAGMTKGTESAGNANRVRSVTAFTQGEIRQTGVATDLAIDGPGFFEIQLPTGATGYTRDGEFHINAQGELVTKQGCRVMGESGPIQIDHNHASEISISATGEISQAGETRGKLKLVDFNDPHLLRQASGYFVADDPNLQASDVKVPSLRQGCLEAANTSSVLEMANLIRVMRGFEANQRLLQAQDDRMGRAIAELGNPN